LEESGAFSHLMNAFESLTRILPPDVPRMQAGQGPPLPKPPEVKILPAVHLKSLGGSQPPSQSPGQSDTHKD
jgi:hypothetical protein